MSSYLEKALEILSKSNKSLDFKKLAQSNVLAGNQVLVFRLRELGILDEQQLSAINNILDSAAKENPPVFFEEDEIISIIEMTKRNKQPEACIHLIKKTLEQIRKQRGGSRIPIAKRQGLVPRLEELGILNPEQLKIINNILDSVSKENPPIIFEEEQQDTIVNIMKKYKRPEICIPLINKAIEEIRSQRIKETSPDEKIDQEVDQPIINLINFYIETNLVNTFTNKPFSSPPKELINHGVSIQKVLLSTLNEKGIGEEQSEKIVSQFIQKFEVARFMPVEKKKANISDTIEHEWTPTNYGVEVDASRQDVYYSEKMYEIFDYYKRKYGIDKNDIEMVGNIHKGKGNKIQGYVVDIDPNFAQNEVQENGYPLLVSESTHQRLFMEKIYKKIEPLVLEILKKRYRIERKETIDDLRNKFFTARAFVPRFTPYKKFMAEGGEKKGMSFFEDRGDTRLLFLIHNQSELVKYCNYVLLTSGGTIDIHKDFLNLRPRDQYAHLLKYARDFKDRAKIFEKGMASNARSGASEATRGFIP